MKMVLVAIVMVLGAVELWAGDPDWSMKVPKPIPGCEYYVNGKGDFERVCDGDLTAKEMACHQRMQEAMKLVNEYIQGIWPIPENGKTQGRPLYKAYKQEWEATMRDCVTDK